MTLVYAHATLKDRQWVIARCPFCGRRHWHGAGGLDGDPREFLGDRVPHCASSTPGRGGRPAWVKRLGDAYRLTDDPTLDGQPVPESMYSEIGGAE